MDRRAFFGMMVGGVAATAAVRTFPFRVYSFPTEITPVIQWPEWMLRPEGYLFNPNSREELQRFMGIIAEGERGLTVSAAMTSSPINPELAKQNH
jgi:hypothetical protein